MAQAEKILAIINWCSIYLCIFIFASIILITYKCRRDLRDISFLLTCNTSVAALLTCITICIMTSSNLFTGFLLRNMTFCNVWGLFYDIFECSIYFSYCLQSFYRLCRIIFYKKKFLVSFSLYIMLIIGQWLLVLVFLLPPIFIDWYSRLPTEQYCLVPYTKINAEVYHILVLYLIPIICIGATYVWITTYMRRTGRAMTLAFGGVIQRQRNLRDLAVIKRIIILISILIVLRFPTIIFMIHGALVGSLYPLTYGIVGIITSFCLIFIGISTIYTTSQLRKHILNLFVHQDNRVQTATIRMNQQTTSLATINTVLNAQSSKQRHGP